MEFHWAGQADNRKKHVFYLKNDSTSVWENWTEAANGALVKSGKITLTFDGSQENCEIPCAIYGSDESNGSEEADAR